MNSARPQHVPVLLREVIEWLRPRPGQVLVDGTFGGGGHARPLAAAVTPGGKLVGLDRDPQVVAEGEKEFEGESIRVIHANFCQLPEVLEGLGLPEVDGMLIDLGWSSDQLADPQRGFSFDSTGPLDMRFDPHRGDPAWRLVERLSEKHLADLLYAYGEERLSRRIARSIVRRRREGPIRTAADLASVVRRVVPRPKGRRPTIDPATRTFQALRIAVNDELNSLETALRRVPDSLRRGGRLAIISYHSLEDRPVKQSFRDDPRWNVLTRRPVRPGAEELDCNPRSRSAKLRVAERSEVAAGK
ncbi:MAG: 16S rRNA (cytosine(1402)-N(4))-methyltransferase RsmH [Pirellulales bacterium]